MGDPGSSHLTGKSKASSRGIEDLCGSESAGPTKAAHNEDRAIAQERRSVVGTRLVHGPYLGEEAVNRVKDFCGGQRNTLLVFAPNNEHPSVEQDCRCGSYACRRHSERDYARGRPGRANRGLAGRQGGLAVISCELHPAASSPIVASRTRQPVATAP